MIDRAVLMSDGSELQPRHLPREISREESTAEGSADAGGGLRSYERALIIRALEDNGWNQSKAARALNISRDNLRYRIKKYNITRPK